MAVPAANRNRDSQFPSARGPLGGHIRAAEVNEQRDSANAYLARHWRWESAYCAPDKIEILSSRPPAVHLEATFGLPRSTNSEIRLMPIWRAIGDGKARTARRIKSRFSVPVRPRSTWRPHSGCRGQRTARFG